MNTSCDIVRARAKTASCPFCAAGAEFEFSAVDWNQGSTNRVFDYFRCSSCGLIFQHPLPSDPREFYSHEQYGIPTDMTEFAARVRTQQWKVDLIRPHVRGKSILEIGPATGEFATVARESGFDMTLVEMNAACCAFLRDQLGHKVIHTDDPVAELKSGRQYDAVCLWQTVEHIPRFWAVLEKVGNALRPGGICVFSTPNPASFQARLMGRRWPHADAPRHLYLIPPAWFQRVAPKWGMRSILTTTRDQGSIGLNHYGWFLWVRNRFAQKLSPHRISQIADLLAWACRPIEQREGRGCSYVTIAKCD